MSLCGKWTIKILVIEIVLHDHLACTLKFTLTLVTIIYHTGGVNFDKPPATCCY